MSPNFVEIFENPWLAILVAMSAIIGYLTLNALMLIWLERKLSAMQQDLDGKQQQFETLLRHANLDPSPSLHSRESTRPESHRQYIQYFQKSAPAMSNNVPP